MSLVFEAIKMIICKLPIVSVVGIVSKLFLTTGVIASILRIMKTRLNKIASYGGYICLQTDKNNLKLEWNYSEVRLIFFCLSNFICQDFFHFTLLFILSVVKS